ncbi:MAG: sodium:calcium antiporter [Rhodobacterales bacterium CG_4_10_14_0_8_um_filter_70_9]|nr:MAG: sodium:calcium antiporter [Rhodobacterales bacterium CG_4_10_14_0_8_um_filter_70_9]PJA60807.1 MAG: sodium:calcium antiporter [Rhodobacterales bacterium CG_4_9_14_3_um_filter_71_31]
MSDILLILGGLAGLVIGGELLVRGAVRTAGALGVSPLIIGLTLVGFGTSTPELVTSVQAALLGSPGVAVGNIVGSNICNILLILGVAALIRPVDAEPRGLRRDGPALAAATLIGLAAILWGDLGRVVGAGFVAALLGYLLWLYASERRRADAANDPAPERKGLWSGLPLTLAGLALVVTGADWLVTAAIALAQVWQVSDSLIGLTIVAVGTSLPELTASVAAAARGRGDVALGNIVGSNIFNILGILGVTALVEPLAAPAEIIAFDVWVMVAATAALIWVAATGARVTRGEGALLLGGYGVYLGALIPAAG